MASPGGRIVVSDTTAITYLANIEALHILKALFQVIYIPEAVYDELTRHGDHISGSKEVKSLPWIKVKKVDNYERYAKKFSTPLDPGEAQAIGLALHINADLLIIDELDGRYEAKKQEIKVIGMLGIFLKAKDKRLIPRVRPYLEKLRCTNFRMSANLYNFVLEKAGELSIQKKA